MKIPKSYPWWLFCVGMLTWLGCSDTAENQLPKIIALYAEPDTVHLDGSAVVIAEAGDADGDPITYTWDANAGTLTGSGSIVTWQAPDAAGIYSVLCTIRDNRGGSDSRMVNIVALSTLLVDYDSANEFMEVATSADTWAAQHFVMPRDADLDSLAVKVHGITGSPGNLVVELWGDELGHPLQALVSAEEISPSVGWNTVALPSSHFVHGGVTVYLVVHAAEGGARDTIGLAADAQGSYPTGYLLTRTGASADWSDEMDADLEFRVIGHYHHALPPGATKVG